MTFDEIPKKAKSTHPNVHICRLTGWVSLYDSTRTEKYCSIGKATMSQSWDEVLQYIYNRVQCTGTEK